MADTEIRKDMTRTHPTYNDINSKCQYWLDCFQASDNLLSTEYIYQHLFESKGAYDTRIKRAFTIPFMRKPFNQFLSIMYSRDVVRTGAALATLRPFFSDATGTEIAWNEYMFTTCMYAMLMGKVYTLVDYIAPEQPAGQEMTLADLEEGNVWPSVSMFTPQALVNWNYIPRKGFEACVFKQQKVIDGRLQDTLLYVDYDTIEETDAQGAALPEGSGGPFQHSLGYTPVFTLSYNGFAGMDAALGALLSSMQKGVTNLCSITDEMSERQAFSQLCFPDDGTIAELEHKQSDIVAARINSGEISASADLSAKDNVLRMLSDSSALTWPAGTGHPPQFISPNANELKNIWRMIKDMITQAAVATGLTDHRGNVTPESAASVMRVFSSSAAAHEERILKTVVKYVGSGNLDDIRAYYPKAPVETDIDGDWVDICDKLGACTWLDDNAKIAAIKSVVTSNLNESTDTLMVDVLNGIIAPKLEDTQNNSSGSGETSNTPGDSGEQTQ